MSGSGPTTPGPLIRDLAVGLADGGDCLSDLGGLREQEALFGEVASDSTARRVVEQIAALPDGLERLRTARAEIRAHVLRRGARPREWRIDLDATLLTAHSEKEGPMRADSAGAMRGLLDFCHDGNVRFSVRRPSVGAAIRLTVGLGS